ncbi:MAG: biopolymer transporter ExbD [Verrucomicrobiota bacterium]
MRFYVRKRRTAPAVIIVALIDVLIVLVIFLLVTTTFRQQPALQITLAGSTQATPPGAAETPPLRLMIDGRGRLQLDETGPLLKLEQLREQLQLRLAQKPDLKLAVLADTNAPWQTIVGVMDATKEIKFKAVNFSVAGAKPASRP